MEGEFVDIKSGNSSQTGEDCALSVAPSSIQPISITNGMHFTSATLALYQVQAYALSTMKSVKIQRRGGVDSRIVCSGAANGGSCPFFVQLYKRRTGMWAISSMCLAHMDCVSVAKPTTKQIAQLPTFVSAVNADNTLSASALIALVSSRDGISLVGQERSVYRAKRMVMDLTLKGLKKSYQLIEPYFDAFKKMNPGSTAIMERDDQVQSAVWSQNRNQRVLGIDCSHSKCQYYGGQQMHLVGRDGNMQNVTIAFALVPSEDIPSYTWFFDILDSHPIDIRGIPIFCDRSKAMLSVADSRGLNLKYCTAHIARNFIHEHSNVKEQHKLLVWGLQACYTDSEYKSRLSWIEKELGSKAMTYLKNIPPERWITIMSRTYKRSQAAAKWLSEGRSMTPAAMKVYESESKEIGKYHVDPSSDDVYFVYNQQPSMQVRRRVTISKKTIVHVDLWINTVYHAGISSAS
ncbi:Mutatorlike Transposase [Phytophthora palmivora]|uniref:Mutatorlike Transposase n=1 Tax=Phytophthora palmivora TaxID=4796 RepID=A0A2P4XI90_9STRA|nr:Mutatorlike Transposase [Phytophthora palmivora]